MGYNYNYKAYKAKSFEKHVESEYNVLTLDKELLRSLLENQAPSEYEKDMQDFIIQWAAQNVPDAVCTVDHYGNIFFVKGRSNTFPCVVSHMDEVNDFQTQRTIIQLGNLFVGMNALTGEYAGCPGDDRVGCYTTLEMLRVIPNIKVAFFVEEEIGGKGSNACDISFFNDCAFILQADRNNNYEIITETNGSIVASTTFEDAIQPYMEKYKYEFGVGTFTDCGVLANRGVGVSCINMGCGYYDAHSEEEKVCLPDVENVLNLMYYFCKFLPTKKWRHRAEKVFKKYASKVTKPKGIQIEYNGKTGTQSAYKVGGTDAGMEDDFDFDFDYDAERDYAISHHARNVTPDDDVPCGKCRHYDCMNCNFAKT